MSIKKKIVWLPYDMDTAIGINNEGRLVFSYNLEDTDQIDGKDIYDGLAQHSVIWNNIRDAFPKELAEMYRTLRSQGKLSYETISKAFQDHQAKWPEALFNEDSQFCYLDPLIYDNTNYLEMLQGSKEEQRKWWLYNRFRYMDSKFNAGDALTDIIQVRSYAKSDITIIPYADIYPAVKFGSYLVSERGHRNEATLLRCPVDALNDTETYIYSASQLASVGDLSGLKVGFADFSMATKLQSLKLGDSSVSYDNPNLTTLTLGNNVLLQTIDVRNCSALGSGDMKVVDVTGCTGLRKAWFTGTKISALTLPIGGVIDELALPSTIANLTIRNQPKLNTFSITNNSYSNITTCRIENTPYFTSSETAINALINGLPNNSRLRLVGLDIDWLADTDEISNFYDSLERFRGLDIAGENLDDAYVEGVIHINSAKDSDIAALKARYPYLNIEALHVETSLVYASYDGTTIYKAVTCLDGVPQDTAPANPTREPTAANTFTFVGWSKSMNSTTADADAQTDVISDRTIYAAYTAQARTYTVRFYNGSTLLETDTGVPYGGSTTYDGTTPVSPDGSAEDYPFEGWQPAPTNIQGDTSCYAQFDSPVEVKEITDSWDTIIANIDNGTYATKYKVGNYKPLDLGTEGTINMQIVAFDADELASGGYAPISFIAKELLNTKHNPNAQTDESPWTDTTLYTHMQNNVKPLIPTNIRSRLQNVEKTVKKYGGSNTKTSSDIWIPTSEELYTRKTYPNDNSRIKTLTGTASQYWLADHGSGSWTQYYITKTGGNSNVRIFDFTFAICLSFCLGLEPETITDSWSEIFAAEQDGTYSTKYSIGDTKELDLGTEGKQLMEIVAFDTDDKADGSGKAKITWISKGLLPTQSAFNSDKDSYDSWDNSTIRSYIKNTIKPLIPINVREAIVTVTKYYRTVNAEISHTDDDVWIPNSAEVAGTGTESNYSPYYSDIILIKKRKGGNTAWWTRSAYSSSRKFNYITSDGKLSNYTSSSKMGIALGFCT